MKISDFLIINFDHVVSSKKGTTQFKLLDKDFLLTKRTETLPESTKKIITRGSDWVLLFSCYSPEKVKIKRQKKFVPLEGNKAILIPAFNFISLGFAEGTFENFEISSSQAFSSLNFKNPILFSWDGEYIPNSLLELEEWIKKASDIEEIEIGTSPSQAAQNAKKYIEDNFKAQLKISDISKNLNYNRSFLSKSFKRTYGFSPLYWRQILRMYDALKQINSGEEITKSIYASGYTSITQYLLFFKSWFDVTPKNYRIPRK